MEVILYDNVYENLTGKNIALQTSTNRFFTIRVTFKDGVTETINPFGNDCVMLNNGLDGEMIYPTSSTTELYSVGKRAIFYINNSIVGRNTWFSNLLNSDTLSNFLSGIEILHDPLPYFMNIKINIKIESEEFEAPNGLFSTPISPSFSGSTFKTAPKIWSDDALDGIYHFPPGRETVPYDRDIYRPFADCPNLTKISKQGKIGDNVKTLGMIDLTYEDSQGYIRLDAYPECIGTPEVVVSYVPPMPDKIVKLSSIPNTLINTKKLKKLHLPFHFREYLIDDTISSLQLPLAGLDFKDKEMESCTLDNFNFSLESSLISDEDKDFTLTLPMLGIVAPKSVKLCENLHTLHMSISDRGYWEPDRSMENQEAWLAWAQENKNHLLTPQWISDNLSYGWGENLKKYYDENELWDYVDENCLPLIPDGVKRLTGYMAKNYVLNGFVDYEDQGNGNYNVDYYPMVGYDRSLGEFVRFSDEQRWMHKDGEPFLFIMKPITLSDDNDGNNNQVTGAYRNLYANLYIDEEITVPSIPKNCNYLIGWCQGLFANSQGFGGYYKTRPDTGEDKAKAIVSWAKSFYKARTETPANTDWGFNIIEPLENSEILEAIDNKNSDYNFVMLAKNNLPQNWYRAKIMVENEVDTKTRLYAYNAYDSDIWEWDEPVEYPKNTSSKTTPSIMSTMSTSNVNEEWGPNKEKEEDDDNFSNEDGRKETNFQKTFKINSAAGLEQLIEEYKNKYSVSIRVNKWNHGVIFDEEIPTWLSSISNAYNQVFFGASVDFEKQVSFPKSADLNYAYQNLSKAYITRNFFFTYARPHTFSGYVERDDVEYTIPIIERTQTMTTCYWYQIMIYYNNFTHLELADEEENLFPGMIILNSLAPTRNASYTRQYQGAINKELFEEGYEVEAQQVLTNNGVLTPLNTIVGLTDTQFLDADAYSKRLQYAAAYDYKYIDKFEHRIKNPSATTSASSFLVKCHLMNIWTNTFKTVPARTYFRTRNTIANVDNFSNRVSMRPVNSDAYA